MHLPPMAPYLLLIPAALGVGLPSPSSGKVLADSLGYLPGESKTAVLTGSHGDSFRVIEASSLKTIYRGRLGKALSDPATGLTTRLADFSPVTQTGTFLVETTSRDRSRPFRIGPDVFRRAAYLAMRSYYGQRCGIAVDLGAEFPGCSHAACHPEDAFFHASSGRKGRTDAPKGWHDAGDYGKYVVNSGIATGTLLMTWEWYGDRWRALRLDIPESGGPLPDLLAEIKWNLDWLLRMQDRDGGVWHKLTSESFCPFIRPEEDHDRRYVIGTGSSPYKSSAATGDFAAVLAEASRLYRPYDAAFSGRCLHAAESAWRWLRKHPDTTFTNPAGVRTGNYGDPDCSDESLWAAVELWRATGKASYQRFFLEQIARRPQPCFDPERPPAWAQVAPLAYVSYLFSGREDADPSALASLRASLLSAAQAVRDRTRLAPWRHSLTPSNFIWGSNSVALNYSLMLLWADRLSPGSGFLDAALDNLHYVLGRNPFDACWVTRLSSNSFLHPHHRPSASNPPDEPWPGLLAGGPNAGRQDPALKRLPSDTPPGLCWVDERESYAGNEVAINWNAPLVFVLSAALPPPGEPHHP